MGFKTVFFIDFVLYSYSSCDSALINKENVIISYCIFNQATYDEKKKLGSGGIRTHASEETGA